MCGLVGMVGSIEGKHETVFKDLLLMDSVRGMDSVGIASINIFNFEVNIQKYALSPHDFFQMKGVEDLFSKMNTILIGHNRKATHGKVSNVNAHPFLCGEVVGAHNGVLRQYRDLPDAHKFVVDSEVMINSFSEIGIEDTYSKVTGAIATTFFNTKTKKLHLLRNEERPLYLTYTSDRKVLIWASESWMLEGALGRHEIEHTNIVKTAPHNLYTLDFSEFKRGVPLDKLSIRKLQEKEEPVGVQYGHNYRTPINSNRLQTTNVTKVIPRIGKGAENVSKKAFQIGSLISFTYNKGKIPKKNKSIEAVSKVDPTQKIRIFTKGMSTVLQKSLEHYEEGDVWIGKVNGYDSSGIIIVQANSVYRDPDADEVTNLKEPIPDDTIEFGGKQITLKEFEALSVNSKSCVWCASPIKFEEGNIKVDSQTTVCPDCSSDEHVTYYLANQNYKGI